MVAATALERLVGLAARESVAAVPAEFVLPVRARLPVLRVFRSRRVQW